MRGVCGRAGSGSAVGWWLAGLGLLLSLLAPAAGEAPLFRHYGGRDGLPQVQVLALHQDQAGFLWAATYGGLSRYDGLGFSSFSTADGLASNTVQAVTSEADGTVWAGMTRGLCALYRYQVRFQCPLLEGLAGHNIQALLANTDGVWVGSTRGLFLLQRDPAGVPFARAITADLDVAALAGGDDQRVWVGARQGLFVVDRDGHVEQVALDGAAGGHDVRAVLVDGVRLWIGTTAGLLLKQGTQVAPAPGLAEEHRELGISGLALGPDGSLWAGTRLGMLRQTDGRFALLDTRHGLVNEVINAVIRDRAGTVWIASDDGFSSYVLGSFVGYLEADGLLQSFVRTIAEDAHGRIWIGTRQGAQVLRVDEAGTLHAELAITRSNGLVDDRIYDIEPTADGAWLATAHGLAQWRHGALQRLYTEADGLPGNGVRALRLRDDGSLWIGSTGGVGILSDGRLSGSGHPELDAARVLSIREDTRGRLWFGSLQDGLLMRGPDGRIVRWTAANGLSDEIIWDSAPDADGGLWVGSNGDGLFHLRDDGVIRRYTTHEGLADNFVWQVLVDRQGQVWAYTNRGLSRFDGQDFWNYNEDDGLLHPEGAATAALETRSGQRWFGAAEGLMRYTPSPREGAARQPVVAIVHALAGGEPMLPGRRLPAASGSLEFHFAAPVLQRSSDLRYRYRLQGADRDWTELQDYRPITYAKLGPGDYAFEVQARLAGAAWDDDRARFTFSIRPALWQKPAFWLLGALLALLLGAVAVQWRLRQIEAGRAVLERLVGERTEALEVANRRLEEASFTDPLTGLRNRRYVSSQIGADIAQVRRTYAVPALQQNRDLIVVMIDVDHFKQINDRHGHAAGDRVLQQYAVLIGGLIRESDYAVRWGGEEFLIVLRQAEAAQCAVLAERIVQRVRSQRFVIDDHGGEIGSTCSVGISHYPFVAGSTDLLDWAQVIELCDSAVYLAKALGRDGWVAIRGVSGRPVDDPAALVRMVKDDPRGVAAAGLIALSGSFAGLREDPESAA
jgi:diguanylate cyclase (GGDEF)-like protein